MLARLQRVLDTCSSTNTENDSNIELSNALYDSIGLLKEVRELLQEIHNDSVNSCLRDTLRLFLKKFE